MQVVFDTSEYQFSHGASPKGRGSWAFSADPLARTAGEIIWTPSMTLTEAKRFAARIVCKTNALRAHTGQGASIVRLFILP